MWCQSTFIRENTTVAPLVKEALLVSFVDSRLYSKGCSDTQDASVTTVFLPRDRGCSRE